MNHHVGEVSYDIRFAREKAKQDIAAIEAEWNAALARMNSKGVGLSGSGAGSPAAASGGYAGQSAGNGQPVQGAPPAPQRLRARDPSLQAIVDAQLAAGNARFRNMSGEDVALPVAPNGQPAPQARTGARILGTSNGDVSLRQRMPELQGASPAAVVAGGKADWMPVLKAAMITQVANAVAIQIEADGRMARNMQNAGANGFSQARAMTQLRRDRFSAIPIIGGSLGNIATASDDMFIDNRESEGALIQDSMGRGFAGRMGMRQAMSTRMSALPFAQQGIHSQTAFIVRNAEIQGRMQKAREDVNFQRMLFNESDIPTAVKQIEERDPNQLKWGGALRAANGIQYYDPAKVQRYVREQNKTAHDELTRSFRGENEASRAQRDAEIALYGDEAKFQLGVGEANLAGKNLANQMRPTAGLAATALGTVQAGINRFRDQALSGKADMSMLEADRKLLVNSARNVRADLEGSRMGVLTNAFGGRPTEIGGMQSIEAMRDISPETAEGKLTALNDAIDKLTRAIENLDKKGGIP